MIRCAPSVTWVESDASLILFESRDGSYHALNQSASFIWQHLARGETAAGIAAQIAQVYNMAIELASESVEELVQDLLAKGLLLND